MACEDGNATTAMAQQQVCLSVPADASFARTVRMMAANLAVLAGMSLDDVEDVRMVAEEGFVRCCATHPASCDIVFTVGELEVSIEYALGEGACDHDETSAYAELILSAVCDEFVCDEASKTLRLIKRAGALYA